MGLIETRAKILQAIEKNPYDLTVYADLFSLNRELVRTLQDVSGDTSPGTARTTNGAGKAATERLDVGRKTVTAESSHEKGAMGHHEAEGLQCGTYSGGVTGQCALRSNQDMRNGIRRIIQMAVANKNFNLAEEADNLLYRSYLLGAPYLFDDYLQAVEYGKPLAKRFYQPRRCYLKRYVDAYQKILDGEIDFLSLSIPKRAGKSQMGINFVNMVSGRNPDKSTLMEGTGDDLVRSFYDGCLENLLQPNDYHYYDIFPEAPLVRTNADTKSIDLAKKHRFPTVMCRSIDARQVGLSEATNLLYLDDCVEGREEAKNRMRLDDKWEVISGDILGRAIEGTPVVICGTRYSIYDPIGRLQEEMRKQGKRMMILETPALDPITDKSNFEFELNGKKIFTTGYFRDQRNMLTAEQFESEFQQQPFEAKGLLFPEKSLNRYFKLPVDVEPDCIVAVCDTADKGEDYCSMPVAVVYGDEVYIEDVVFDDSPPNVTKPEVANVLSKNNVSECTFESNNAGSYYARDVQELLTAKGSLCSVRTQRTISNKQTRIEFASDNIVKHFWFKDSSLYARNSQYALFMKNLTTYTRTGKVAHDDAPDSLAMLENVIRRRTGGKVEFIKRALF